MHKPLILGIRANYMNRNRRKFVEQNKLNEISNLEIEPLSDESVDLVAAGQDTQCTTTGPKCCSCSGCSNGTTPQQVDPSA